MAISSQTSSASYTGNASTVTPYPVTFRYDADAWVTVEEIDEDGVVTTLALGTDYTLTGTGSTTTGNVVTGGGAIPATSTLRISRNTALTQTLALTVNGVMPSTTIEAQLDKLVMSDLDQKRRQEAALARSIRVPDGELATQLPAAATRAGRLTYFNAVTGAVETISPTSILALSDGAPTGTGIPTGGTVGQFLAKLSSTAADVDWRSGSFLNVLDYGATGDGVTDDTAAIQATIAAAAASTATRTVFLPPGTYLLASNLTLPGKVSLVGCGNSTVLQGGTNAENGIEITSMEYQVIRDLKLAGPGYATSTGKGISAANGAATYGGFGLRVSNVEITDWNIGYYVHSCNAVTFDHVRIGECAAHAIKGEGVPDSHVFISCWVGWGSVQPIGVTCTAVHVDGAKGFDFLGSDSGNVDRFLHMTGGSTVTIRGGNFESFYGASIINRVSGNLTWEGSNIMLASGDAIPLLRSDSANGRSVLKNLRVLDFGGFTRAITAGSRTSNVATVTIAKHGLNIGDSVTIAGVGFSAADPNGVKTVTGVPTVDTLTFASAGSDETFTVSAAALATLTTSQLLAECSDDTPIIEQTRGVVAKFSSNAYSTIQGWWTEETPYYTGGPLTATALNPGTPVKIHFDPFPGCANIQTLDSGDIIFRRPGLYQISASIRHTAFTSYATAGIFEANGYQNFQFTQVAGAAGVSLALAMAYKATSASEVISIRSDNGGAANVDSADERTRLTIVQIP